MKIKGRSPKGYIEDIIDGKWIEIHGNRIFVTSSCIDYPFVHGNIEINQMPILNNFAYYLDKSHLTFKNIDQYIFFDIETSNLNIGTSSFVFLIGICWFNTQGLNITQIFLDDFPSETLFISYFEEILKKFLVLVSYNGKSFDVPMLRTRMIMNRTSDFFHHLEHIDLLHLTRKIFKRRLSFMNLSNVEQKVIGFTRSRDDVPGWLIPQIYFDYLENENAELLESVFYHNKMDIISLSALTIYLNKLIELNLDEDLLFLEDLFGLADILLKHKNYALAQKFFEIALNGDLSSEKVDQQVLLKYGYVLKKGENLLDAVNVMEFAAEKGSVNACIDLAKYYEHKVKQYDLAIRWVEKAKMIAQNQQNPIHLIENLEKRYERLLVKRTR